MYFIWDLMSKKKQIAVDSCEVEGHSCIHFFTRQYKCGEYDIFCPLIVNVHVKKLEHHFLSLISESETHTYINQYSMKYFKPLVFGNFDHSGSQMKNCILWTFPLFHKGQICGNLVVLTTHFPTWAVDFSAHQVLVTTSWLFLSLTSHLILTAMLW